MALKSTGEKGAGGRNSRIFESGIKRELLYINIRKVICVKLTKHFYRQLDFSNEPRVANQTKFWKTRPKVAKELLKIFGQNLRLTAKQQNCLIKKCVLVLPRSIFRLAVLGPSEIH